MAPDQQDRPPGTGRPDRHRHRLRLRHRLRHRLVVGGGALAYPVLGLLPWVSVTYEVLGRVSASGYAVSVLVPSAAVLLVAAAAWVLLPALTRLPVPFPRDAVTAGLAGLAALLTLATWLRSTDHGFQPVPLVALLVAAGVVASAVRSVLAELRTGGGGDPDGGDPDGGHPDGGDRAGPRTSAAEP